MSSRLVKIWDFWVQIKSKLLLFGSKLFKILVFGSQLFKIWDFWVQIESKSWG